MNNLQLFNTNILRPYSRGPRESINVAVVGNSGVSPEDNDFIDGADCVVRFNNYATRDKITHTDDRKKCDILFSTFDLHSAGTAPKDVVIGIPFPFKAKEIALKPARWYPKSRHWMVNPYDNMQMCMELNIDSMGYHHPIPSIGFTALWHMRNWKVDFYIAGFSWYYDPTTHKFQNWDLKNKEYPKTWNHNYPREIEWIIKNLMPKNNVMFSPSCTKVLNIAKHLLG